jgi:hypothetical protein
MRPGLGLSRRALLELSALGLAASSGLALENPVRGQERISKAEVRYRNAPNGIQRCEICLQFKPPKQCELVDGDIRPNGWCQYFAGKENEQ